MGELDASGASCSSAVPVILAPISTSRPALPDRQTFQRSLSEYNDQIAIFTNEVCALICSLKLVDELLSFHWKWGDRYEYPYQWRICWFCSILPFYRVMPNSLMI